MSFPFFYIAEYDPSQKKIVLNEETSKHVVHVLRMKTGEKLNLTDGKGHLLSCEIISDHKKHCSVNVTTTSNQQPATRKVSVAISLLKNSNRFEWFLEKATEIGVNEITPLICERTVKEKFRYDRMQQICISAMLQSQQTWLPVLYEPVQFGNLIKKQFANGGRFIAHCGNEAKQLLAHCQINELSNCQICIGPEGDFTKDEIELALKNDFTAVTLGETRLRTETAGIVAATLLCQV